MSLAAGAAGRGPFRRVVMKRVEVREIFVEGAEGESGDGAGQMGVRERRSWWVERGKEVETAVAIS